MTTTPKVMQGTQTSTPPGYSTRHKNCYPGPTSSEQTNYDHYTKVHKKGMNKVPHLQVTARGTKLLPWTNEFRHTWSTLQRPQRADTRHTSRSKGISTTHGRYNKYRPCASWEHLNRCLEIRLWGAPGTPNEYVCDNQVTHSGNEYLSEELQELEPCGMIDAFNERAIKWEADGIITIYLVLGTQRRRRLLSTMKAAITH